MTAFVWAGDAAVAGILSKATGEVAAYLLATVKASHRPGFGYRTGALAGSYTASGDGSGWQVGTGLYYAPFVEYGTSRMAAQAHLRNAAAATVAAFPGVSWSGG